MSAKKSSQKKDRKVTKTTESAATQKQAPAPDSAKVKKEAKPKKVSALDAAAKVLGEHGKPMNCQELIDEMSRKAYWTSPNGATPQATLYSAIAREIKIKGAQARFQKSARGQFAYQTPQAS
jgi:hypothetical protein